MPEVEMPDRAEIQAATDILMRACHGQSWRSGWWHDRYTGEPLARNHAEMIALIHSELSEALEGFRTNATDQHLPHRASECVELADAVIRCFDMLGGFYPDASAVILEKLSFNAGRADHKIEARRAAGGKSI